MIESRLTLDYMENTSREIASLKSAQTAGNSGALGFSIGQFTGQILPLDPIKDSKLNKSYIIGINGVNYTLAFPDTSLSLDLSTTGLNGLADGITFVNGDNYLFWAVANDSNDTLQGLIATRKPFDTYSGISGTSNKGDTAQFNLIDTNAYQYTAGARVRINTQSNITNGIGEWNLGSIISIDNGNNITILLDNNSNYGSNITSVTGFDTITQLESFQPWFVDNVSQTLQYNNFTLLGEIYTDSGDGHVTMAYKVNDEWRQVPVNLSNVVIFADPLPIGSNPIQVSCMNIVPPWATQVFALLQINGTVAVGDSLALYNDPTNNIKYHVLSIPALGLDLEDGLGCVDLSPLGILQLLWNSTVNTGQPALLINNYRVPGGMQI